MLAMEACKISDRGQLNLGFIANGEGVSLLGGSSLFGRSGSMLPREILKSETSRAPQMQSNLSVSVKKFLNRRL
jgi:hypothetical protein